MGVQEEQERRRELLLRALEACPDSKRMALPRTDVKGKLDHTGRDYYPTPDKPWQRIVPASGGFYPVRLADAIALA